MQIKTETSYHRPETTWTEDEKKYADGFDYWMANKDKAKEKNDNS